MSAKLWGFVGFTAMVAVCFSVTEAVPAYPGSTFNSWDPSSQQRRNAPAAQRPFQNVVRQPGNGLDKQTQSDLKILGYLENELNKIFSCYIKLSCPRTRTQKVLTECNEIKDWPLYHQVMKMAGIKKYPYISYAPTSSPRLPTDMDMDDNTEGIFDDEDEIIYPSTTIRPNRRFRRGSMSHSHLNEE